MGSTKQKQQSLTALVHLSPDEAKKLLRPRIYFDVYAEKLLDGYEAHVDQLRITGLDPADVRYSLAAYRALGPEEEAAERHLALVKQTRKYHASIVWATELEIYLRGQLAGRTDEEVAAFIADFEQFMKHRHKKPSAATAAPPVTTPVVPKTGT